MSETSLTFRNMICTRGDKTSEKWPIYHQAQVVYKGESLCLKHFEEQKARDESDEQ